ncbi:Ribosomal RNA small subunit methyltransferase NEP1 [Microtus ochrogaster]|uniref:Ribosomal RNA small subunit methyltransferase NEP1 n=1 Tax=Microtus ochrogaster TaxID=79684 RepID=A0A8J6KWM6_MICOH|nr:Ribosomal RNA small subunit methyltransferase NEP1 [Microtus ochrogaster]
MAQDRALEVFEADVRIKNDECRKKNAAAQKAKSSPQLSSDGQVQLLHKLSVRAADGPQKLLKVIKNPVSDHFPVGYVSDVRELVPSSDPVVFVVGTFVHGKVQSGFSDVSAVSLTDRARISSMEFLIVIVEKQDANLIRESPTLSSLASITALLLLGATDHPLALYGLLHECLLSLHVVQVA